MSLSEIKQRGRPKKYLTEEEKLKAYNDVHKDACRNYWRKTLKKAKKNGDTEPLESNEEKIIITVSQLEEMVTKILTQKLKFIFSA